MRREPDFFGDLELTLIYIAKRLKEALALEEILTQSGVNYLVEPDTYRGGIIFASARIGAFFYVAPADADSTREVLQRNRYKPYRSD